MINSVVLVGRTTKDVQLRYTNSGIPYVTFTLAINRPTREERTDFISCIAWRNQAENLARYMGKGSMVGVEGRIETGSYEKDGITFYTTDINCFRVNFYDLRTPNQQGEPNYNQGYKDPREELDEADLYSGDNSFDDDDKEPPY